MADISRLNQPSYSLGYVTGPITCWNNLVVQHNWGKDQEGFAWLCHVYLLPPTYWVWTYACYNTCLSLSLCVTNRRWRLRVHKHQYRRCCNVYRWGQRQRVKPKQHLSPHCQVMLIEFQHSRSINVMNGIRIWQNQDARSWESRNVNSGLQRSMWLSCVRHNTTHKLVKRLSITTEPHSRRCTSALYAIA